MDELTGIDKHINSIVNQTIEKRLQTILSQAKSDSALSTISEILETIAMALEEIPKSNIQYLDANKETSSKIIELLNKIGRPQVTLSVDMEPLNRANLNIARLGEQILAQNQTLSEAIKKLSNNTPASLDLRPITAMIERSNDFIQQCMNGKEGNNYSSHFDKIGEALSKQPRIWEFEVERDRANRLSKVVATAK